MTFNINININCRRVKLDYTLNTVIISSWYFLLLLLPSNSYCNGYQIINFQSTNSPPSVEAHSREKPPPNIIIMNSTNETFTSRESSLSSSLPTSGLEIIIRRNQSYSLTSTLSSVFSIHKNSTRDNISVSDNVSVITELENNYINSSGPIYFQLKKSSLSLSSEGQGDLRLNNNSLNKDNRLISVISDKKSGQRQIRGLERKSTKKNKSFSGSKKTLWILGLFELTQNNVSRESGESERTAAQLALDDINGNESILPGYQLAMHTNDTQCDPGTGVDAFFHALYMRKESKIISLLGTACSEVTERLAKVTTHQRVVQVSFGSTSPSLSDRKEFPLFYRTVAPVSSHAEAIIELIRYFNWDTVSFFTKNENRFTMPVNHLVKELEEKGNITCKATLTFSLSDFRDQLQDMKDLDSRIIIANFGTDVAPLVFCEIYRMDMYGSDYAWILIGKPETEWWKERSIFTKSGSILSRTFQSHNKNSSFQSNNKINNNSTTTSAYLGTLRTRGKGANGKYMFSPECSLKQLAKAIENTLVVDRYNVLHRVSDFGLTTEAFSARLRKAKGNILSSSASVGTPTSKSTPSPFAPETYDAVWAVALGLKQLKQKYNYSLENFNYMDDEFSHALNEEIGTLNFTGISGPITFSGSDRIGITSFMQVQGGNMVQVGLLHPDRAENKLELSTCVECRSVQWPGNQVPIARREFRIKLIRVEGSLYIIVASVAFLGILMAAAFLAFNLYYRKLKYIKLSSPRLNNMVIIGCIFAYVAVILLGSDFGPATQSDGKRFSYICTIRAYLLSMGFSLAFGAMFAKTYRVHRIFTRSCIGVVKNKLLKDTQLMTLIMALLLIDVIIVTSWAGVDPMHRHLWNLTLQIDPSDRSVVYQPQIEVCRSQHGHVWLGVMYGYKSLLLVVGIYMAWETRRVKIQALNDSKNIAYCVYIVVLTSVLAVSLANLISERVTLSFVSVTSLILTSTTVTLCLLFLPKIHAIKTGGHKGDPVVESLGLKIEFNTRRLVVADPKEDLFRAEVQNRVFKRQIEAVDVEIWKLENLLSCSSHSSQASFENLRKQEKDPRRPSCNKDSSPGGGSLSSSETSEEIYTVYLHGPRFIVPISLFNFQNPNAQTSNATSGGNTKTSSTLKPPGLNNSPSQPPRSSWPNIRSLLAPSNGLIAKKYRFKSEPKLLIEELENESSSNNIPINVTNADSSPQYEPLPLPRQISGGVSDDSIIMISKSSSKGVKSLRKGSNTSCGGPSTLGSKRASILSALKHPLAYFTGVIRSGGSPTNIDNTNLDFENFERNSRATNPPVFHLSVPRDSVRQKYSSVPDLWAVRSSPTLQQNRKKTSVLSDSVVDTSTLSYLSNNKDKDGRSISSSNPVLKLTVTSDESPYL